LTESVGPVPFSAQYLICRHVRTDRGTDGWTDGRTDGQTNGQTDGRTGELIQVELGNLFGSSRLTSKYNVNSYQLRAVMTAHYSTSFFGDW
jgi:hypothetical protein